MQKKIKETCGCGAIMEYEEDVTRDAPFFGSRLDERQDAFHNAHQNCRASPTKSD